MLMAHKRFLQFAAEMKLVLVAARLGRLATAVVCSGPQSDVFPCTFCVYVEYRIVGDYIPLGTDNNSLVAVIATIASQSA